MSCFESCNIGAQSASPIHIMECPTRPRIIVSDHQELISSSLACLLECHGYQVVGQACNGIDAVNMWRKLKPDIALLDMRMPEIDGIAAAKAILSLDANARIIILSMFDYEDQVVRAFSAGARGYLVKSNSPEFLYECIETVYAGGKFIVPELAKYLAVCATAPEPTKREIQVLSGVAQGLCNKRIARDLGIEEGTVKAHLKNILRKLEANSRTQAASIAIRRGLVDV